MKLLLRWKIFRLCRRVRQAVQARGVNCWVWWFGAYYVDPKHLVVVAAVPTDAERNKLRKEVGLSSEFQKLLQHVAWPAQAQSHVIIEVESEETVARENNGNWWHHYK